MSFISALSGIVVIVLGFGFLIFVHELGHFLAAKWAGIRTEGFAVGMGPVVCAWRKGIGLCFGSTERKVVKRFGRRSAELTDRELDEAGLGETEYSLRWLPIGGFVKMLGQDDTNPNYVSEDPRSYNMCPVGKRMIVVSAGVIMNVLLALVLFAIAFKVGVQFEAPVVGEVRAEAPAGMTMAENAEELGVTTPGLRPGDVVTRIGDAAARTFADIQIASAMSRPDVPLKLTVARAGVPEPLRFTMTPKATTDGLLSIGIGPARSTRLLSGPGAGMRDLVQEQLDESGLGAAGVRPGMVLVEAAGRQVSTFDGLAELATAANGAAVPTRWQAFDERGDPVGEPVAADVPTRPVFQQLFQVLPGGVVAADDGLLGFGFPLRITETTGRASRKVFEKGDMIVRAGDRWYPRWTELTSILKDHARGEISMVVERNGENVPLTARVDRHGRLGIGINWDESVAITTTAVPAVIDRPTPAAAESRVTPAAALDLLPGTRIQHVAGAPVTSWGDVRAELLARTADASAAGTGASVPLGVIHPTPGGEAGEVVLELALADVAALHGLGWAVDVPSGIFDAVYTTRRAEGSPIAAVVMGFHETHKLIVMTYLTIDRLFRGTVGVEQLRGPVGIIDLGAKILPRGFMYFLFFLGMISVNLAVINFLPLPIVDGGLFLFLIYEKLKGRPPSPQFQNVATVVGLFLIGTVFVVTFYNDIARLIG